MSKRVGSRYEYIQRNKFNYFLKETCAFLSYVLIGRLSIDSYILLYYFYSAGGSNRPIIVQCVHSFRMTVFFNVNISIITALKDGLHFLKKGNHLLLYYIVKIREFFNINLETKPNQYINFCLNFSFITYRCFANFFI